MVGEDIEELANLVVTIRWLEKRKHCLIASLSCFTTDSRPLVPPLFFSGTTLREGTKLFSSLFYCIMQGIFVSLPG